MKNWIQMPMTNGEELNIKKSVNSRLINTGKIDELLLDISGQTGKIVEIIDGKRETFCTADPESITGIWIDLLRSLDAETVDFTGCRKDQPVNFSFPCAEYCDVISIVNTFLIKTDKIKVEESLEEYERIFLSALFGYLVSEAQAREQNLESLNLLLKAYEFFEEDPEFKNAVDMLFEEKEEKDPNSREVAEYKKFKGLPIGKQKHVWSSCVRKIESLGFQPGVDKPDEVPASWNGCSNW